jgi:hypothetical protein
VKTLLLACVFAFSTISGNATAQISMPEQAFIKTIERHSLLSPEHHLFKIVEEKFHRHVLIEKCFKYELLKSSQRITDPRYFSALTKTLAKLNTLATSELIPKNALSEQGIAGLLAYRQEAGLNAEQTLKTANMLAKLKFLRNINLDELIGFYEDAGTDVSTGEKFPNALHEFRGTLDHLKLTRSTINVAKNLGYSKEFNSFLRLTSKTFSAGSYAANLENYKATSQFLTDQWKPIAEVLLKSLDQTEIKKTADAESSSLRISMVLAMADTLSNVVNSTLIEPPIKLNTPAPIDFHKLYVLTGQHQYGEPFEQKLGNAIPSLKQRLEIESMVNWIIREQALTLCSK